MISRERLTRCFFGQETDRPAVYTRTGYASDASYDRLKAYMEEFSDLKYGYYGRGVMEHHKYEVIREPYSKDFDRLTYVHHTPKGELRQVFLAGLTGHPGMVVEHFIKDEDDCEKYLSLPRPQIVDVCDEFFETDRRVGERGITDVLLGFNPAGTVAELMGSEVFAVLSLTHRDLIREMCARETETILRMLDFLTASGVGPFFSVIGQEYIVPPLHGRQDFFDFNVKYDKQIADKIHNMGGRLQVHCHGPIKLVLDGFLEIGADVLHPIEPPPMGNVTAAEARAILGDRVCIEGNIQISSMYENTPQEIYDETKALIRDAYVNNKGLIICPSASPYIPGEGENCFAQYKAMVEAAL